LITQDAKLKHLGDVLEDVIKEVRASAGKSVPSGSIFTKGQYNDSSINMWVGHWLKHRGEFPIGYTAVNYVNDALDLVNRPGLLSKIRPNKLGHLDPSGNVILEKVFMDPLSGEFSVQTLTGLEAGSLKTYFKRVGKSVSNNTNYFLNQ
jgi:hypothetical protein